MGSRVLRLSESLGDDPAFLEGRRAVIFSDGNEVGILGEVHPDVISNFGLQHPTVGFELVV